MLKNQANGDCVFLRDGRQCTVYGARPLQCSSYPWWPELMDDGEGRSLHAPRPAQQHGLLRLLHRSQRHRRRLGERCQSVLHAPLVRQALGPLPFPMVWHQLGALRWFCADSAPEHSTPPPSRPLRSLLDCRGTGCVRGD